MKVQGLYLLNNIMVLFKLFGKCYSNKESESHCTSKNLRKGNPFCRCLIVFQNSSLRE